ncbi:chemokine-like protein TAFA-5 isoform X4 [Lacerta agilis]|uniref:chemokine-like protein TAFA-5 isoform X4 n=1 Tax=Lacerta agilis TaxID=80427 RepID=UPI0014191BB4|nr:chemokine-like protein TAFA-5 isoform X4 [Lacerta agilis]
MQVLKALWAIAGAAICCFLIFVIHSQFLKEGQLAAGTCEIVTLDRDSSQPRRTIARQTARCACKKGQIAGTTRARPACVDDTTASLLTLWFVVVDCWPISRIIKTKQWCEMLPCLEGEGCDLLINKSGWTCTQPGGRIKTTTRNYDDKKLL